MWMMSIATNTIPLSAALETRGDVNQEGGLIGDGPNFLLNDNEMSKMLHRYAAIVINIRDEEIIFLLNCEVFAENK